MTIIEAYQEYSAAGFSTLPTKQDKSPDVRGTWKGGINNSEVYRNSHGIGVICGQISGNLECLDFDNHFGNAKKILSEFLQNPEVKAIYDHYQLPIESTVSGGFHLLYRCSEVAGNQKLAQRPKKQGERWIPDTIIETRGEGGYFCADPTPGYKVIRNEITIVSEITPSERQTLINFARSFNEWNNTPRNEFEADDKPGNLFNEKPEAIEEMKKALSGAGWKEITPGIYQRPGKKAGISATLGKVAPNVFYNFSANGHPFENNHGYTPFQVISLLEYNGDFSAFAKEIVKRYDLHTHQERRPEPGRQDRNPEKKTDYSQLLKKSFIDLDDKPPKPPVIMRIVDYEATSRVEKRLFTLGNFSVITGKSKSKKTFLSTMFLAAATGNKTIYSKIIAGLPEEKQAVYLFDTEQSDYDSWNTANRIPRILGRQADNFGLFNLREFTPRERCEIIEAGLNTLKNNMGFVVIDGIADLATGINDEDEATRVVSLLLRWTKVYNCHISTIVHQNKQDSYATGHLGSALMKKAETVISVKKDDLEPGKSLVQCQLIRGERDFDDFEFFVNSKGLPELAKKEKTFNTYTEPNQNEF